MLDPFKVANYMALASESDVSFVKRYFSLQKRNLIAHLCEPMKYLWIFMRIFHLAKRFFFDVARFYFFCFNSQRRLSQYQRHFTKDARRRKIYSYLKLLSSSSEIYFSNFYHPPHERFLLGRFYPSPSKIHYN